MFDRIETTDGRWRKTMMKRCIVNRSIHNTYKSFPRRFHKDERRERSWQGSMSIELKTSSANLKEKHFLSHSALHSIEEWDVRSNSRCLSSSRTGQGDCYSHAPVTALKWLNRILLSRSRSISDRSISLDRQVKCLMITISASRNNNNNHNHNNHSSSLPLKWNQHQTGEVYRTTSRYRCIHPSVYAYGRGCVSFYFFSFFPMVSA